MNRKNRKRGSFRIPIYVLLAALAVWLLTGGELSALPFPWK